MRIRSIVIADACDGRQQRATLAAWPGQDERERWFAATLGAVLIVQAAAAIDAAYTYGYRSYVERSQRLGLSVEPVVSAGFFGIVAKFQ